MRAPAPCAPVDARAAVERADGDGTSAQVQPRWRRARELPPVPHPHRVPPPVDGRGCRAARRRGTTDRPTDPCHRDTPNAQPRHGQPDTGSVRGVRMPTRCLLGSAGEQLVEGRRDRTAHRCHAADDRPVVARSPATTAFEYPCGRSTDHGDRPRRCQRLANSRVPSDEPSSGGSRSAVAIPSRRRRQTIRPRLLRGCGLVVRGA